MDGRIETCFIRAFSGGLTAWGSLYYKGGGYTPPITINNRTHVSAVANNGNYWTICSDDACYLLTPTNRGSEETFVRFRIEGYL